MSFAGFEERDVETPRGTVHARVGGEGPPLLLLHGFPQTHVMWHPVAEALAARHTVVAADLPGYGASFRPEPAPDHASHSQARARPRPRRRDGRARPRDASRSPATTAAAASPTGWRSTIPGP